jgi:hypothetical protein
LGRLDQSRLALEDSLREPGSLNGEPRSGCVVCGDSCWSFRDVGRREFDGDGRKRTINSRVSGISGIGFNFLKDLTIRTLLSIEVEVVMKYEWNLWW